MSDVWIRWLTMAAVLLVLHAVGAWAYTTRWWERVVKLAPFLIGFAAPVFLLLAAYLELGRRARHLAVAMPCPQAT